jgi:hypothetical protein
MSTDNIHQLPTASQPLSTAGLNLWAPPERLTDAQIETAKEIAERPLPALPRCEERHLAKCLRIMLAVLPKQNTDGLGGELFVEAYMRQIGHYPNEAISHLADRATASCRWFPTIAECLDILSSWRRNDLAKREQDQARHLLNRERNLRWVERQPPPPVLPDLTQAEVDAMNPTMLRLGLGCGAIEQDDDGNYRPAA